MVTDKLGTAARRLLPRSRFARSVSVLAGGTAAGQIIVVAASPVLTRLYSPEDFGLLAVYAGLLGIFGVVASLRYQLAIPLPESDDEAVGIAVLSLLMVFGTTLLSAILVGIFGDLIAELLNTPALAPYFWLLPVGLLLTGVYQVFYYWAIRTKAYSGIAKTKLTQAVGMVGVQIGGYVLGPVALLLGRVVGQSVGILTLARLTLKGKFSSFSSSQRAGLHRTAIQYRNFPLLSTWTGLSSSAGTNLPPILIAALLGAAPAGIFALTHRVLSQPMAVVGKAVGDVFYRQAAQAHREGNLDQIVDRVYSSLVLLTLPAAMTIFIIAPEAFVIVFGSDWSVAGEAARWMTPWLLFQFIATPPTRVYPIIDEHGIALRFQLSLLFSNIASILLGGFILDSLIATIIFMSIFNSLIYLARLMTTYSLIGMKLSLPLARLAASLPWAIACNLPLMTLWLLQGTISVPSMLSLGALLVTLIAVGAFTVTNITRMAHSETMFGKDAEAHNS